MSMMSVRGMPPGQQPGQQMSPFQPQVNDPTFGQRPPGQPQFQYPMGGPGQAFAGPASMQLPPGMTAANLNQMRPPMGMPMGGAAGQSFGGMGPFGQAMQNQPTPFGRGAGAQPGQYPFLGGPGQPGAQGANYQGLGAAFGTQRPTSSPSGQMPINITAGGGGGGASPTGGASPFAAAAQQPQQSPQQASPQASPFSSPSMPNITAGGGSPGGYSAPVTGPQGWTGGYNSPQFASGNSMFPGAQAVSGFQNWLANGAKAPYSQQQYAQFGINPTTGRQWGQQ